MSFETTRYVSPGNVMELKTKFIFFCNSCLKTQAEADGPNKSFLSPIHPVFEDLLNAETQHCSEPEDHQHVVAPENFFFLNATFQFPSAEAEYAHHRCDDSHEKCGELKQAEEPCPNIQKHKTKKKPKNEKSNCSYSHIQQEKTRAKDQCMGRVPSPWNQCGWRKDR